MSPLHLLAQQVGLQIEWEDASGKPHIVADESLRGVLAALGYSADSERAIADSLNRSREESAACAFITADRGEPITLPEGCARAGAGELTLESGATIPTQVENTGDGLVLPGISAIGYHSLRLGDRKIDLAVAPRRCLGPADLGARQRQWAPAVQVPSLRDGAQRGFGDFGSLAATVRAFAEVGADALAISPVHALFPADPSRFSPYAPSSRLFLNVLFGDPALIGHDQPEAPAPDLIDWESAIPQRLAALREAFDRRSEAVRDKVSAWRSGQGEELERHAIFDALFAHHFPKGASGWQDWPAEYHDPSGEAVARFAAEHREDVDFYIFAQWLAVASLDAAQNWAREAGMAVGLIADLAVGMDGGGSHAWSRREDLLTGLSIGAPPDPLGPYGQNWGITGFSPAALKRTGYAGFKATLRAALDHAGGVRIDHVLGLNRLWVIPHGASSAEGAYLTYPVEDMLRILAIESHKASAIVIGEDLGTVPQGLRPRLENRNVLGMRVLWFERENDGGYVPPHEWQRGAVAMTGTHDLVTVAGWWRGRDIDWSRKLGRSASNSSEGDERAERDQERGRLWQTFVRAGVAAGPEPACEETDAVVDAATAYVAGTPCELAILPLEDIAGLLEQPNIPGTIDEHPNWRRRMPVDTASLLDRPAVIHRIAGIEKARK